MKFTKEKIMRMSQIVLSMLVILSLQGCTRKTQIVKQKIPQVLLVVPTIEPREIKTNKDASIFMLDIYNAYEKCVLQLEAIREVNE